MTKLVEFIPNFSEGRRQEVIDQISEAAQGVPGAKLINVNVEPSYNRCVTVRPLKWHASWVQNVVRQFGLYLSWAYEICVALTLVREDRVGQTSGLPVVPPGALPGI